MADYLDDIIFETDEDQFLGRQILQLLYYDTIHLSEEIDLTKINNSKECMVCDHSYFFHGFKLQNFVYNGFHGLMMWRPRLRDVETITVKCVDYCCVIHDISKSTAIHLLVDSAPEKPGYI